MKFILRLAEDRKDIDRLTSFIWPLDMGYKGYYPWVERAIEELLIGEKEAMLAFYYNTLIGDLIFQHDKYMKGVRELKHGRTLDEFRRRLILSCMIRQVEVISREEGDIATKCDIRSYRPDVMNLLRVNGYREVERADLYREGYEDIVFMKPLRKLKNSSLFQFV